jgi:ribosome maturation factor RimP
VYSELPRSGGQSALKVYIDKPNGITLEDCRHVSEKVSVMLDVEDLISARYTLEVSSPGLDRPLLKEQDYVRFQGRRAKLRTRTAINGQRNFKGVLGHCQNGAVVLLEDDKKSPIEISLDNIQRANLLFELKN